jgi:C-terminal processing protease CtpA/Prc
MWPRFSLSVLACATLVVAPGCTHRDAHGLIEEAAEKAQRLAYYADRVDWKEAVAQAKRQVRDPKALDEAYPAIDGMLRQLRDGHSFLLRPDRAKALADNTAVDDIVVESSDLGDVVAVAVPTFAGMTPERERSYATRLHAIFERPGAPACGWVVDLRQNQGGNMFPMLAGLAPLIGTDNLGAFVSRSGEARPWPTQHIYTDTRLDISRFEAPDLRSAPVAVITGFYTMSSGEAVAIAFRGRPNTRSFGEPTAGKSTANQGERLSDGSMLLVTAALMADRNGVLYGIPIQPDERVDARAGTAAEEDHALAAAVNWLRGNCAKGR